MKYICFVASPFQLISLKEFIYKNKISKYVIYQMKSPSNLSNMQMNNTVKILKLKNIFKYSFVQIKIIRYFQMAMLIFNLVRKYKNIKTTIVFGDHKNTFFSLLSLFLINSNFILIDDGFGTYTFYKKYKKKRIHFPSKKLINMFLKINKFSLNFFAKNINFKKIEIFTIYANELNLMGKSYNSFNYIKNILLKKRYKLKYSNDLVYFIGTKHYEAGSLTLDTELKILSEINAYWIKKGKKMIYLAKRSTSQHKIDLIKKKLFIQVISNDLSLELAFIKNHRMKIARTICSFGSTVDKSLPMIYKSIKKIYWIRHKIEMKKNKNSVPKERWIYKDFVFKSNPKIDIINF